MKPIKFTVNGKDYEVSVPPWRTLLEVIREELGLTGTKEGCGLGECGACTIIMDKGKTLNPTFLDYKMPLAMDVPRIKLIDIVTDDPFGAKETSEGSIVSAPPAVVSAIHDATGIWFTELPVTPEKVVKALRQKGQ